MTGEDPTCSDKYKVDGDALDHLEYMGLEIAVNAAKC
jgi:hypothetical protein